MLSACLLVVERKTYNANGRVFTRSYEQVVNAFGTPQSKASIHPVTRLSTSIHRCMLREWIRRRFSMVSQPAAEAET